jgi:hypothetical protein
MSHWGKEPLSCEMSLTSLCPCHGDLPLPHTSHGWQDGSTLQGGPSISLTLHVKCSFSSIIPLSLNLAQLTGF